MSTQINGKTTKIIPRSAAGLRDACFDMLERIRDGQLDTNQARDFANVARVVLESVEIQMEFEEAKIDSKVPAHLSDMSLVPPLNQLSVSEQHVDEK